MPNASAAEKKIPDHWHQRDKSVDAADRKNTYIKVRLSMTERAKIDKKATAAGLTISEYVRRSITAKDDVATPAVTICPPPEDKVPAAMLDICQYVANANGIVLKMYEQGIESGWDVDSRHTRALKEIAMRLTGIDAQLDDFIAQLLALRATREGTS